MFAILKMATSVTRYEKLENKNSLSKNITLYTFFVSLLGIYKR